MSAKQKIMQGRGPSKKKYLASLSAPLMFAGLQNQSPLLSMMETRSSLKMAHFLYETCLQGIMVVLFKKTNLKSKMINTTTMIHCRRIS